MGFTDDRILIENL